MENKTQQEAKSTWSPRSQASLLRQEELDGKRVVLLRNIEGSRQKIRHFEQRRDGLAEETIDSGSPGFLTLEAYLSDLRVLGDLLELQEGQLKSLDEKIRGCIPTAETTAVLEENQHGLTAVIKERLALDRQVGEVVAQVNKLLKKRAALTGRMADRAANLEMKLELDQERFDTLANSLRSKVAAQSEIWSDWVFGRQPAPVHAVVYDERLVLPETLAHSGIYYQGEAVELTKAQFDELSRTDRPGRTQREPWRCQLPSVISVEKYKQFRADPGRKGLPIAEALFWDDINRQEENRRRYLHEKKELGMSI